MEVSSPYRYPFRCACLKVNRSLSVLNGNVAALKSVVGEITDDTNKALAFSLLPLFWAVGGVVSLHSM
jgi:hypothetical protein